MYNSKHDEDVVMMLQYYYMYCTLPSFRMYTTKLNAAVQVDYWLRKFDNHWRSSTLKQTNTVDVIWITEVIDYTISVFRLSWCSMDMHKYETLSAIFGNSDVVTTQQCTLHCKLTKKAECEDPTHIVQTILVTIFFVRCSDDSLDTSCDLYLKV